jgi:hypothetical protein
MKIPFFIGARLRRRRACLSFVFLANLIGEINWEHARFFADSEQQTRQYGTRYIGSDHSLEGQRFYNGLSLLAQRLQAEARLSSFVYVLRGKVFDRKRYILRRFLSLPICLFYLFVLLRLCYSRIMTHKIKPKRRIKEIFLI